MDRSFVRKNTNGSGRSVAPIRPNEELTLAWFYSSIDGAELRPTGLEISGRVDAGVKCNDSCTLKPVSLNVGSRANECQLMAACCQP
jgi:hypothetical protein